MVLRGDWLNSVHLMHRLGQPVKERLQSDCRGRDPGEQGRTQQSSTVNWLESAGFHSNWKLRYC